MYLDDILNLLCERPDGTLTVEEISSKLGFSLKEGDRALRLLRTLGLIRYERGKAEIDPELARLVRTLR